MRPAATRQLAATTRGEPRRATCRAAAAALVRRHRAAVTVAVCSELADPEPPVFDAVTMTSSFLPTSVDCSLYVLPLARQRDREFRASFPGTSIGERSVWLSEFTLISSRIPTAESGWAEFNRVVHDCVVEFGGSISAEHGIGRLKRDELAHYKSATELSIMRRIKDKFLPAGQPDRRIKLGGRDRKRTFHHGFVKSLHG